MNTFRHKGYEGTAAIDVERNVCHGKLLFIDDLVTYESGTSEGLRAAFEAAVDDYLETCRAVGKEAQRTARGAFNVRVPPELHREAIRKAAALGIYLNDVVVRALDSFLHGGNTINHHHYQVQLPQPGSALEARTTGRSIAGWNVSLPSVAKGMDS